MTEPIPRSCAVTDLGRFVGARVAGLQERYLAGSPSAQADLARLRRAAGKAPGEIAEVWDLTLGGIPHYGNVLSDEPTPNEWACHITLTMYALHQRSRSNRMHVCGTGLGEAVRQLRVDDESAITRRFNLVATATNLAEVAYHARSLVGSLRNAGVGLDYGLLADQLVWLQLPSHAAGVRLAWGRDFYRDTTPTTKALADPTAPTDSNGENT